MNDKQAELAEAVIEEVIKPVLPANMLKGAKYLVNPTGRFEIGGPHGDAGLTGRKIIVDTYGGAAPHGGGAFSGKDPSKVDRSAAYAARYVAKNIVAAGIATQCQVQLSYAIGVARPINVTVYTEGTGSSPTRRSPSSSTPTSICGRRASSACSTCCARSTSRPPRTDTSAATSPSSRGRQPTRCRRFAPRRGSRAPTTRRARPKSTPDRRRGHCSQVFGESALGQMRSARFRERRGAGRMIVFELQDKEVMLMAERTRTRRNTLERRCLGKAYKRLFVGSTKGVFKMLEKIKKA